MATGIVKWFNQDKGYGFIAPDDRPTDVFVYLFALQHSGLTDRHGGQKVSFELAQDRRIRKDLC